VIIQVSLSRTDKPWQRSDAAPRSKSYPINILTLRAVI
jgi:hypothetical protein